MSQFHPMFLSNEENQIISSILDDEESELKNVPFSTQSNINVVDQNMKTQMEISKSGAGALFSNQKSQQYIPSQNDITNFALQQNINEEISTKKRYDINSLKSEVDDLMMHVRQRATRNSSMHISGLQPEINMTGLNIGQTNRDSNVGHFQFTGPKLNNEITSMSNSSQMSSNNDNRFGGSYFLKNIPNSTFNNRVEFLDFPRKKNNFDFSYQNKYSDLDEKENEPFTLPKADFPDSPKILKYQYGRRPDTSKHDMAELDQLRKENFKLKSEMLKLEKRLQLEEAEHTKLDRSLKMTEQKRAKICEQIQNSGY